MGPYQILSPIGAGGMGEVYRARDERLKRDVAIKVLPASFSQDADRLKRFEQEAQAAGALNHPNITAVYDFGMHDGAPYIVTELLEGETLRSRLGPGAISPRKAIEYAVQIAKGLAAAHEKGIVHRDLKPENVFLTKDGRVKILDFGLAKLKPEGAESGQTDMKTVSGGTEPGVVLGTMGYMSPEQVRGKPADKRSDLFAFGTILYEMLSGQRAFRGDTAADTITAILTKEPPDLSQTNKDIHPGLDRIARHCLEKNPEERFESARDVAFDLENLSGVSSPTLTGARALPALRTRRPWALLALAAILGALVGVFAGRRTVSSTQPTFQRLTFQRGTVSTARFGPDGSTVYFTAAWDGAHPRIYSLRPGNPEASVMPLPAAELLSISSSGEMAVLIEPNYALTGFALHGTLARVPSSGAAPKEVLANASFAEWAPGGSDLAVVHRMAGKDRLEYPIGKLLYETAGWLQTPRFSSDGQTIAFIDHSSAGDDGAVAIVDRAGKKTDLAGGWATVQGLAWSPDGREIWFTAAREGIERMLYGVTPAGKLRLIRTMQGTPALLDVRKDGGALITEDDYRASVAAFGPGEPAGKDLTWFDWSNDRSLSADGRLMLFDESGEGGGPAGGVYLRSTDGAPAVRLGDGVALALSPDSAWALTRTIVDPQRFVLVPVKIGQPKALPPDGLGRSAYGVFVPDGSRFVFVANTPGHGSRLYVQDVAGGSPKAVSEEGISAARLFVSPDSRWIAAVGPDNRVHLYPLGGGSPTDLPASQPSDSPAGWTADGKGLYVAQLGIPCRLDLIDIASGRRTHVRDLSGGDAGGVTSFGPVRITPDGRTTLIGVVRILSTLYQVQGLQ
jgi:eukaryotic-like serine/threonine-protein kinase